MLLKVLLDHLGFASGDPELGLGAPARYLNDVLEVPEPLDVAGIVPAEVVALPLLEHEDHGIDPLRVF